MLVALVHPQLLQQLRARVEARGASLDFRQVYVGAAERDQVARVGERQAVVDDHGAAVCAGLARCFAFSCSGTK